jgi:segregation and condensation protein B
VPLAVAATEPEPVADPVVASLDAAAPVATAAGRPADCAARPVTAPAHATALKRDVEALLFASGAPLGIEAMTAALATVHALDTASLEGVLASLADDFPPGGERGIELVRLAGGWALRTNPRCRQAVSALFELPDDGTRLSSAAMEVLAIIAYLQPVSRAQISEIRGVNSDSPLRTLADREFITEVGRAQSGGGAVLYGTTERFQAMFGLAGLEDLPDLEGFALGEEQKEGLRRRLGLLGGPE